MRSSTRSDLNSGTEGTEGADQHREAEQRRRVYDNTGVLERLEKARLDKELRTAADVQRALLSRTAHLFRFCESVGDSVPCRAIGGDFFEYVELPSGDVGVAMGDVAGKGPAAALLSAMLHRAAPRP